jgi:hypothetical protein
MQVPHEVTHASKVVIHQWEADDELGGEDKQRVVGLEGGKRAWQVTREGDVTGSSKACTSVQSSMRRVWWLCDQNDLPAGTEATGCCTRAIYTNVIARVPPRIVVLLNGRRNSAEGRRCCKELRRCKLLLLTCRQCCASCPVGDRAECAPGHLVVWLRH